MENILKRLNFHIEVMEDMGGTIFYDPNSYPLEYALLFRKENSCYVIYEIQRGNLYELFMTYNSVEAEIYMTMYIEKKLGVLDDNSIKVIDDYINNNDIETVIKFFDTQSFSTYFSIGKLEYGKISMIIDNDEKGTVYFHNKEFIFCKNAPIKIALSILADFSQSLKRVTELYDELPVEEKKEIDFDNLAEKYIEIG